MNKNLNQICMMLMGLLTLAAPAELIRETRTTGTTRDGNREWTATHQGPRGREAITRGQASRTDDGRQWRTVTERRDREGNLRTCVVEGTATRGESYDGLPVIHRQWTRTRADGTVIHGQSETIVMRTEQGRSWQTVGTRTGPDGERSFEGSGNARREGDTRVWQATRQGEARDGRTWRSETSGRGEGGSWESTTRRQRQ